MRGAFGLETPARIRTSLDRYVGRSPTPPEVIERLARQARAVGVIVFTKPMLDRMDDMARRFIEGEHERSCQRGGR